MNILRALSAATVIGLFLPGPPLRAVQRHVLNGHVPPAVALLQPNGELSSTTEMKLAIGLPLRERGALTNLLAQLYNPAHPNFRHFLTPQEFTERFGPTKAQYERVITFARTNGLAVSATHPNRLILDVRGTVANIQRAFQTTIRFYAHPLENRSFYAPDLEPSVDPDVPILDITGFNNFRRPRPKSLKRAPAGAIHAQKGGSGPNGNYIGQDFRAAYLPGVTLTGSGQILGLLEFDGYYPNDIAKYASLAGLSNVPLQNVLLDGFDGTPTTGADSGNNEVALDIEVAISMAPGLAKILVYEAGPDGYANDIISRMAADNLAAQLSCSWDFGSDANATTDQIFLQFAAQGQCFFNASGDSGAYIGSVPSPDDNPYIVLVGGTTLSTTGPRGSWVSETTWNAGGGISSSGGVSSSYPLPAWQQGINMSANQGSAIRRNIPDVAMVADDISIIADNGQQYPIYGTSASAPLWAGFTALVNEHAAAAGYPRAGFLNPALYSLAKGPNYSSYFHDVLSGNNTNSTTANRFRAVAGYDLCTGWGSPTGIELLTALALPDTFGILPGTGFSASGPVGGPFSIESQTFSLTNSGNEAIVWALGNGVGWLDAGPPSGTLPPGESFLVVAQPSPAANNLAAGNYTASLRFTNLSSLIVQARQFRLAVGTSSVLNGGFESGDFSYWTLSGNSAAGFNSVDDGTAVLPHSGNYVATFGQIGSLGTLSQTLTTRPGQTYLLSFWLTSQPDLDGSTTPNEFRAKFDGRTLFDAVNLGILDWTNIQFVVTATGTNAMLEFGFLDNPYYLGLDDIALLPIPFPSFESFSRNNGMIQFSWRSLAGLSYQVQYRTQLTQDDWVNLGAPKTATTSVVSATDSLAAAPARFYRVVLVH